MDFFSSEIGITISWICTVLGFLYGFKKDKDYRVVKSKTVKTEEYNLQLKSLVNNLESENLNLKNQVIKLNSENNNIGNKKVGQQGEKNIYNEKVTGGMKIEM
ncbi:hypothetical protein VV869_16820 [Photobacterium sp. MCCC 1A19761]|uniref:hypothetical protein n=1 Tax=Photobacterium sp. MCCC 1A19761 TaxID=3115000 RepID=UPI00307EC3A2